MVKRAPVRGDSAEPDDAESELRLRTSPAVVDPGDVEAPTPRFSPAPSAMLVGVTNEDAERLVAWFPHIKMLRVGHAFAARERMMVTRPLLIIVGDVPAVDMPIIEDRAMDICAEIVLVRWGVPLDQDTLRVALVRAEGRRP